MKFSHYLKRINWKLILVHSIGTWFFMQAFYFLICLYDITLHTAMTKYPFNEGEKLFAFLENNGRTFGQYITYVFYTAAAWKIGVALGFLVSLYLAIKNKWFWVNALVVLILMVFLEKIDLPGWSVLKRIYLPGKLFDNPTINLVTNGSILLGLGLFVFFFKRFIRFINSNLSNGRPLLFNNDIVNTVAES